ncbi:MAG: pro-sigmaK processing inhibitor BofA family protein [Candidatus Micrarchaeaceae archaeon]
MMDVLFAITAGAVLSEIIVIAAIILVLYVIFKLGSVILGLVLNSILGLVLIWVVNLLFGLGISFDLITWIVLAIFGLPAAAVIIVLKLVGISI